MNNLDFRKEKNNHKILLSIYTDNFLTRTATENIIKHIQDTNFLSDKEKQKRIDYLRKDYEYKTNVNEIYFEGSKGAGKTKAIVRHILEDMVFDRRVSAFVIMDRLKESRDKTMREVEEELQAFNEEYDNVKSLFSFKRASDNLRIELKRPDGHKQEIYFENVENIAVAGQTPPLGTYFKYRWCEELTKSSETKINDLESKELIITNLKTLDNTLSRRTPDGCKYYKIFSFNAFNMNDPIMKVITENKVKDRNKLILRGMDYSIIEKGVQKILLVTSNFRQNTFLNEVGKKDMIATRETNPDLYEITGIGMSGMPTDFVLSPLINKYIKRYDNYTTKWNRGNKLSFIPSAIGVDVGWGNSSTTFHWVGFDTHLQKTTAIEIFVYNPKDKKQKKMNFNEIYITAFMKAYRIWKEHLYHGSENFGMAEQFTKIPMLVDGSEIDKAIPKMKEINTEIIEQKEIPTSWLVIKPFKHSWKTQREWHTDNRIDMWYKKIELEHFALCKRNAPNFYEEMIVMERAPNGKRKDTGNHSIDGVEYGYADKFIKINKKRK